MEGISKMRKWMHEKKKIGALFLVFVLLTVFMMPEMQWQSYAASPDFILTHDTTETLSKNEKFDLNLKMRAIRPGETISDIVIDFSQARIAQMQNMGTQFDSKVPVSTTDDVNIGSVPMIFTGDGSESIMPVLVTYKLNGDSRGPVTVNLVLNVESSSGGTNPDPVDTTKYKPEIVASVSNNLVLEAGEKRSFDLELKNISTKTSARNIIFNPVYKADSPFVSVKVLSEMPIEMLSSKGSTNLKLSVEVDKFASDGIYPLTFLLKYTNAWNDEIAPTEHTVYIEVKSYQQDCNLNLNLPAGKTVTAKAGEPFELPLIISNDGTLSAKDVKVSISASSLSQDTFMLSSGAGRVDFYKLFGNETRSFSFNLIASNKLKTGSYPITFTIDYKDEKGTAGKVEQQIWIPVAGSGSETSNLEILEINPSKTTVKTEDIFSVSVKIKNSGKLDVNQIKVSAETTEALLPVSQNLIIIQAIKKGETYDAVFRFQPNPDAQRGSVPITIKVEPVNGDEGSSIAQAISVFIDSEGKGDASKNVPKIIVNTYSSEPTLVKAGEQFVLNVQFRNTHASKTVRNIKGNFIVTEQSNETGNVFSPVGSSNTFYIDKIAPNGTYDWTLTLYTIPDAKSKTYTVTISFEYEDEEGNPYKGDELIGIPVYQPSRFETSEISIPSEAFVGQPMFVGFELYNLGKTDIYNVKVRVEGDFEAQPKSNYFGNFTPGYREYFEFNIIPTVPGQVNGRIIFEYETASGEKLEYVKDISMNVMEMSSMPVDNFPMDPMEPGTEMPNEKGFFGSVWFYIILGVVVAGVTVAIILIVRKRRKKKEEFEF